jgi:hypothetical protein
MPLVTLGVADTLADLFPLEFGVGGEDSSRGAGGDELRTTRSRAAALNSSVAMTIPAILPTARISIGSQSSANRKTPYSASDEGMTKSLTWRSLAIRSPLDNSLTP